MRRIKNFLLLFLIIFSVSGCGKKELSISINQDTFQNQNASAGDNQSLVSEEVLPEETVPTVSLQPTEPTVENEEASVPEEITKEIFHTVDETVYATAYVKIRSNYTTKENNVVAILEPGGATKRIGIGKEWSKVEYDNSICYIMSEYLTSEAPEITATPTPTNVPAPTPTKLPEENSKDTVTPVPSPAIAADEEDTVSAEYSFVNTLSTLKDLDQLVCVIGSGSSDCTVSFHKKDRDGKWVQVFRVDGDCGLEGITYQKREQDNKTPAGLYSFTLAFGLKSDPGAFLNYRKITEYDYWVDDINSPYYNTWVNSSDTSGEFTSEHLIDHSPSYNYALNINYNPECKPGLGSAVFLHCYNGTGSTTGCIAIPETNMKTLVKEVDRSTRILIIPNEETLSDY